MSAMRLLLGMVAVVVLVPSGAAASTYCVGTSGADCKFFYAGTGAGLQTALTQADTNVDIDGTPDTVRIGPGAFVSPDGFHTTGGDIAIEGAGESTILTALANPATDAVLAVTAGGTGASVRRLQVQLTGAQAGGGIWNFRELSDVHVGGPGTLNDDGIVLPPGGRLTRALIDPAASNRSGAINASTGVIEDTLIRVRGSVGAGPIFGALVYAPVSPPSPALVLRHVTILGDGSPAAIGVRVTADRVAGKTITETVQIRDSLLHGLATPIDRRGEAANPGGASCKSLCFDAVVNVDVRWSSVAVAASVQLGPGAVIAGPDVLADPEPVLAPDGSPLFGSPLVNAGDPAGPESGDAATDLAGNPRIQVGRRDIGALESPFAPPPAPPAPAGAGPSSTPQPTSAAPVVSALSLSRRRFRVGRPPRRGTTVRFTLSAAARYTLAVDRVRNGRRVVKRGRPVTCRTLARAKRATSARACKVYSPVGAISGDHGAGTVGVRFAGRLGAKILRPGAYRLTVRARDSAGRTATPRTVTFTIVA